eukprot:snap_masked-scaffold_21-processed-gene-1.19-mRNA-1 protein AED:1.00 eAED:1.00 QI:0/0/0/0/1/1/2/0/392
MSTIWSSEQGVWYVETVKYLCKEMRVHYRFPKNNNVLDPNLKKQNLLLHLPGRYRTVNLFKTEEKMSTADKDNVVILSLEFIMSEDKLEDYECPNKVDRYRNFPDGFGYNFGNVGKTRGGIWYSSFDRSNYIFEHIENTVHVFEKNLNIIFNNIYYFGFSAGAQVLNRHLLLGNFSFFEERITKVCASSPLHYTFPISSKHYGGRYPYSLVETPIHNSEETLFSSEFVNEIIQDFPGRWEKISALLTCGGNDNKPRGTFPEILQQGNSRLQRMENYFYEIITKAETYFALKDENFSSSEFDLAFLWEKSIAPGIGHNSKEMSKVCWNYFFQSELSLVQSKEGMNKIPIDLNKVLIFGSYFIVMFFAVWITSFILKKNKSKEKKEQNFKLTSV